MSCDPESLEFIQLYYFSKLYGVCSSIPLVTSCLWHTQHFNLLISAIVEYQTILVNVSWCIVIGSGPHVAVQISIIVQTGVKLCFRCHIGEIVIISSDCMVRKILIF